jgi:cytochrome c556
MYRVVALALLFAPAALSAPPSPGAIAKYRHEIMETTGGHMSALGMLVKGESDRKQDAVAHAEAIADLSKIAGDLFPEGSGPAPGVETHARPEIWKDKDKFAAAMKNWQTESEELVAVAKKGDMDAFRAQFQDVGKACGACHENYRVKDQDDD